MAEITSLRTLSGVCFGIQAEKEFHQKMATAMLRLFNSDTPIPGAYTNLQEFYQRRAEYHVNHMAICSRRLTELEQIANSSPFE
jgi:hypothetical protein